MEFAASIANYAADELVSTRKELRYMTDQHEKIYNEKSALDEKMLTMEKKMLTMEKKMLEMEAKLTMWSTKHIITEYEAEWSKAITDIDKIRMIEEKYDIACKMESIVKKSCQ
jgi:hypothetical protein